MLVTRKGLIDRKMAAFRLVLLLLIVGSHGYAGIMGMKFAL
jgi:hypothetical protein